MKRRPQRLCAGNARLPTALGLLLCLGWLSSAVEARVIVVGVDGGSWNLIDPMIEAGELPQLAALIARGASAELKTLPPVNSPSVWTTIATGHRPDVHGVTDFHATQLAIRVPTAFERLAASGRRVGLYDYLVTWPPTKLPGGFVIPGWLRHDERTEPPDVWQRAGVPPFVIEYTDTMSQEEIRLLALQETARKAASFAALARGFDLEVGAVTLYALDQVAHRFWSSAFPEQFDREDRPHEPVPPQQASAIRDVLAGIDHAVGEIAAGLGPDDSLLVISDHGFERNPRGVERIWLPRVEALLAEAGLQPERDGFHIVTSWGVLIFYVHEGPFEARDAVLDRLLALTGGITTADAKPVFDSDWVDLAERPAGSRRSLHRRMRQWAIGFVAERIFHINTERRGHAYVFLRPRDALLRKAWPDGELQALGQSRPASTLFGREDYSGDHADVGILIAVGPAIAHRATRARLSALDVAPLLLHLAGAPIPDDLEGRLPEALLSPEALAARPIVRVPADALPGLPRARELPAPGVDPELSELLRRLGYLR